MTADVPQSRAMRAWVSREPSGLPVVRLWSCRERARACRPESSGSQRTKAEHTGEHVDGEGAGVPAERQLDGHRLPAVVQNTSAVGVEKVLKRKPLGRQIRSAGLINPGSQQT